MRRSLFVVALLTSSCAVNNNPVPKTSDAAVVDAKAVAAATASTSATTAEVQPQRALAYPAPQHA